MKKILFTAVALLTLSAGASAQVTIGSTADPQDFSILELVSNGALGLRLPQMTTAQRDDLEPALTGNAAANGLEIFNTTTRCVETWNGTKWIQVCPPEGPRIPPISPQTTYSSCGITPNTGSHTTFTAKQDTSATAHEFFLWDGSQYVPQGEQESRVLNLSSAVAASTVSVKYYYPLSFLKPKMIEVAGTTGDWIYGETNASTTSADIPDFYMSETEITQAQFEYVMGALASTTPYFACGHSGASYVTNRPTSALPVEYVNWYHAIAFCNKLSIMEGRTPCYSIPNNVDSLNLSGDGSDGHGWRNLAQGSIPTSSNTDWNAVTCNFSVNTVNPSLTGYRLPTESEWEYAAREGTANSTYTYSGSSTICDVAWYIGNNNTSTDCGTESGIYGTKPVATKSPNALGLYDMSGNVYEWCWNWYNSTFPASTPTGVDSPSTGSYRILRGGYWDDAAPSCRVSRRISFYPSDRNSSYGFRVAVGAQ